MSDLMRRGTVATLAGGEISAVGKFGHSVYTIGQLRSPSITHTFTLRDHLLLPNTPPAAHPLDWSDLDAF